MQEKEGRMSDFDLSETVGELENMVNAAWDAGYAKGVDWAKKCGGGIDAMTDTELAEHGLVRGPLDADGKMWRSGDMSDSNWGVIEGIAYEDGRWLVSGHDTSAPWIPADSIRHHHAPTVEDVLREFTDEVWNRCCEGATASDSGIDELVAEYAAKLRLADDGVPEYMEVVE